MLSGCNIGSHPLTVKEEVMMECKMEWSWKIWRHANEYKSEQQSAQSFWPTLKCEIPISTLRDLARIMFKYTHPPTHARTHAHAHIYTSNSALICQTIGNLYQ
jgi:hypothetical protein